jgi:molecular chaperone DnaJ
MPKDYYHILGIKSDATPDQIRSAYRELVKKLHPDRHGEDSAPFLALQEAYETLIDPSLRKAYDDDLSRKNWSSRSQKQRRSYSRYKGRRSPVEPLDFLGAYPQVEDLTWEGSSFPIGKRPISPDDSLMDRLFGRVRHKPRTLFVEMPISLHQARHGGRVRIVLPLEDICPNCYGDGYIDFYRCPSCGGMGRISKKLPILVKFSSGMTNNSRGRISLDQYGLIGYTLDIHFRIV